ncbi:MAG: tyrosine-type recombinase/integrase [Pseudonocardiaceae bacterium]
MGYVETLPSGRYRGVPWLAAAGRRRGKSQTFDRWSAADAYWRRAEAEADGDYRAAGVEVSRQQRGIPLFAAHVVEWAQRGLDDCELSTLRGYRSQARMLAKRWPIERVDEITELMIREYLTDLRDARMSPSTRTLRLTVLRHSMRNAVKAGYRTDDPTLTIRGPKPREHEARILTEPELMLLLACLPGWLWPAALLSHDAGLRIDEIAGLRVKSLNLLHGTVTIVDVIDVDGTLRHYPKGKVIRDVPLSGRALAALRDHVRDHPPAGNLAPVFGGPRGGHLRPGGIRDEWDRALELAQLDGEKPTWHDLRHGCGTGLAEAGADPWVIAAVLGHRSIKTTQRYVRRANLTRQAAAVGRAFGAGRDATSAQTAGELGAAI